MLLVSLFICHLTNCAMHLLPRQLMSSLPLYNCNKCLSIVEISGELGYWVKEKNLILWISMVWMSCWEGWLEFELIYKIVGNTLSKKFEVVYFELLNSAAFPITSVKIECKNSQAARLMYNYPFRAKKQTRFNNLDKLRVHLNVPINTSI